MEGIYTINPDGSNEQQLAPSGTQPSWQGVAATNSGVTTAAATSPGAPNTGAGAPQTYIWLLPVLLCVACIAVGLLIKRAYARVRK
jgi:hypothetical protein